MILAERKNLLRNLAIALLLSFLAAICLEMILSVVHLSILPLTNPVLQHAIHLFICFLVIGGCVLAWHLFPSVRNFWAAVDYHLLDPQTRNKAVDVVYSGVAMVMLLHHVYVTLNYSFVAAGAQKFTPVWIVLAAVSIMLSKSWRDKGWLILSFFLILVFERVFYAAPDLPGNTVIILSSAIYSIHICYLVFSALCPSFRKPFLKTFCFIWTLASVIYSGIGIWTAWTGKSVSNLVGSGTFTSFDRLSIFYGINVTGGVTACCFLVSLAGFFLAERKVLRGFYLVACIPMILATTITDTRVALVCISVGLALIACFFLIRPSFLSRKKVLRILTLLVIFLLCFAVILFGQVFLRKGFNAAKSQGILISKVYAEEPSAEPVQYFHRELSKMTSLDDLFSGRLSRWQKYISDLAKSPLQLLFGRSVAFPMGEQTGSIDHSHNLYIQILLENGLLGLGLFLTFLILFLKHAFQLLRNHSLPLWQRFLPVPAISILVMESAECLSHFSGGHVPMTILWFFMGCTITVSRTVFDLIPETAKKAKYHTKDVKPAPVYNKQQLFSFLQKIVVVFLSLDCCLCFPFYPEAGTAFRRNQCLHLLCDSLLAKLLLSIREISRSKAK